MTVDCWWISWDGWLRGEKMKSRLLVGGRGTTVHKRDGLVIGREMGILVVVGF